MTIGNSILHRIVSLARLSYKVHGIIRGKNPLKFRSWQYYMLFKGGELNFVGLSHSHVYHLVFPFIR
jgi:hypothetical protein